MLILSAVVSLALSAGSSPLAACAATPMRYGWEYDCGDLRAQVEDRPEAFASAAGVITRGMQEGAAALLGAGAETRSERRKLGGVFVDVYVMRVGAGTPAVLMTVIESKSGMRTLACFGREPGCNRVLIALAELPWRSANVPGSVRRDPAPLALAGRAVPVPDGCQHSTAPGSGRIDCGKRAWLQWFRGDEETTRRASADNGPSIRATLVKNAMNGTEDQVACRIAGSDTRCGRVVIDVPAGEDVLMLWGAAPVGDEFVFATCMAPGAPEVRSPCTVLFSTW